MNPYYINQIKLKLLYLKRFFRGNLWFRNRSRYFSEIEKGLNEIIKHVDISQQDYIQVSGYESIIQKKILTFGFDEVYKFTPEQKIIIRLKVKDGFFKFRLKYGFLEIPKRKFKQRFKVSVFINGKIKDEFKILPKDFFRDHNREFQWNDLKIPLQKYQGTEIEIELTFHNESDLNSREVYLGITHLNILKKEKVNRTTVNTSGKNIVLIVCDALRYDKVFTELTPFLNSIRDRIVELLPSYTTASWTWPATTSILSGQYPFNHGIYRMDKFKLYKDLELIQEIFQRKGYVTSGFSSNPLIKRKYGFDRGFDSFLEIPYIDLNDFFPFFRDWVSHFKKYNFFSYIHCMDTHTPYLSPGKFKKDRRRELNKLTQEKVHELILEINSLNKKESATKELVGMLIQLYDAQVRYFDHSLEMYIQFLEKEALLDNTVILITADHGEEFFEREHLTHGYNLYETLVRVPCLIMGKQLEEVQRKNLYINIDFFPTMLNMAGIESINKVDGESIFQQNSSPRDCFISTHYHYIKGEGWYSKFGLISGEFKIIYFPKLKQWEFYNLISDPHEQNNLYSINKYSEKFNELRNKLDKYLSQEDLTFLPEDGNLDRNLEETLKGLGYI